MSALKLREDRPATIQERRELLDVIRDLLVWECRRAITGECSLPASLRDRAARSLGHAGFDPFVAWYRTAASADLDAIARNYGLERRRQPETDAELRERVAAEIAKASAAMEG